MSETARRRPMDAAVKALMLEMEAKLAAISKSQAIVEFDLNGAVLSANARFLEAFGYCEAEVVGRHHSLFVKSLTLESAEYRLFWERLRQGHFHAGEYERVGKDGRQVWIQATYNPILDLAGRPFKVIKYATDVTQAKLQYADFSGQIEAISKSQAVVEFDLSGRILKANDNFLRALGYGFEELVGNHHRMLVDPDEVRHPAYERFWSDLRAGRYRSGEYRRIGRDGREIWLQASYTPIRDLNNKPFKIVKYASDITEVVLRKREEAGLRAAREAAEAAAAAKTAFLANMSHELRTPLTSILGFSRLIAESQSLSPVDREHIGLVRSAGDTLLTVINDILDFSKLEAGAMSLSPHSFGVSSLLDGVCRLLGPQARDKGLTLEWSCEEDATLWGDGARLRQVLLNLIGNAVKFTAAGRVEVRAHTHPCPEGARLEIEVEDTGIGMSSQACERLFNRFVQVDGSITRRFGGTGLGLAISRQIVELMGGTIQVTSEEGRGSTFLLAVALPVTEEQRDQTRTAPPAAPERPVRVLIADDHPANRKLVETLLTPLEVVVDAVENGEEAVCAASGDIGYDLILMDMHMPVMDGPTAARAIRELSTTNRKTPIVALTANILPEQIKVCMEAGMQGHLSKPIKFEALLDLVHEISTSLPDLETAA